MNMRKKTRCTVLIVVAVVFAATSVTLLTGCEDVIMRDNDTDVYNSNPPATGGGGGGDEDDDGGDRTSDPDDGDRTREEPPGIAYDAERTNNMLLIDRSGSMAEPSDCGETSCLSKWDQLLSLRGYLTEVKLVANLGLTLFPSPEHQGCSVESSVMVPITDSQDVDERIMDILLASIPGGRTPMAAALDRLAESGELDDPEVDTNVIILTDGQPNCICDSGDSECERSAAIDAVERLMRQYPELDVYIIGFGASAHEAHDTLTAMAQVGGENRFYQADTIEDLIGRLYEVAIENVPCTFYLDEWPEPENLIVWMDQEQVPPCQGWPCESGYVYEPSIGVVDLVGDACEDLRDGERHMVWFEDESGD
jgi:hypothetical protein